MEEFRKLGLSKGLVDVLQKFGFTEPTEIQKKAIPIALKGRDIIGGSATGSGKTLAFASIILEKLKTTKKVQALVLTPTRELAEQVATSIRNFGENKRLNVLAVYGGVNIGPQISRLHRTDILVGTPGRILDHLNRGSLKLNNVKFLVLDEVDRMFDMGFREDVEKIINECHKERQTMMFSATISQGIDYLSKKYTKNPAEISVKSYVDPSKLKQVYYDVPDNKKFSLLVSLLKEEDADLVMVFCSTRRNVDFIANNLKKVGINAKAIHGGIVQKKRIRVLEEFHKKGLGVLVATDVAARGLDIKGVSHVYNYDVPNDAIEYIHRIGRTARAGKNGKAITILASRDYEKFGTLIQSKEINITSEKLPDIAIIRITMDSGRRDSRFKGPKRREFGRGQRSRNWEDRSKRRDKEEGNDPRRGYSRDRPRGGKGFHSRRPSSTSDSRGRYSKDRSERKDDRKDRDKPRSSNRSSYGKRPNFRRGNVRRNNPRSFQKIRR